MTCLLVFPRFLQLFFAVTGAMGHIGTVLSLAPSIFLHTAIQICVHFCVAVYLGSLLKLPFKEVRYGMVWYGMVWCGVVWCGVVWCGVV